MSSLWSRYDLPPDVNSKASDPNGSSPPCDVVLTSTFE